MALFYTVSQSHCVVIERFGKFSRIQREGLHFRIPGIEIIKRLDSWGEVANKRGFLMELTEQQTDTPTRQCHTKDNVAVNSNASVYWRIVDPRRAIYEIDSLPRAVADIALNALRSNVGTLALDALLSERQSINENIAAELSDTARKWGIQFTRVEIQEIQTSDETSRVMRQQMDAERRRRAAVAEAEGQAVAEVKVAEAQSEAAVLRAEGQAKALAITAEAEAQYLEKLGEKTSADTAAAILIAQKYISGFDSISKNPSDKVFLPSSFQGIFSIPTGNHGSEKTVQTHVEGP